ncbi:GNAT family N-acetyltransferase [Halobacillus litoralis]|uniref:GNAT family N-acetyltransferase n=1 Tax=Halobacillus litoralis TaxID=45668 RepID=A0A410MDV1_9BACI|nr:GNAT family N-acetyltransferase [Halobacillus litoralis]QAS52877.1 GNAT family N-acetyltransferase [Halobacillus litoralis]
MGVTLHTERLDLQPFTKDLAQQVTELAGDEAVAATTFVPHPYTLEVAEEWIAEHANWIDSRTAFTLAMILRETDELVGTMTLRVDQKHSKGELAYWVGKPFWNKGYASEAARKIVEFGLNDLDLHRIWSAAIATNPASTKVMQKAGLSYEGTLKHDLYHRGEYKDIDVYGLVKQE